MSLSRRLLYIAGGFLLALVIGYLIFTGSQVELTDLPEFGEETAGDYG